MRRIACCAPSVIESASSSTTTLCLPGGSVTFFWANALIRFRTTSIPRSSDALSSSTPSLPIAQQLARERQHARRLPRPRRAGEDEVRHVPLLRQHLQPAHRLLVAHDVLDLLRCFSSHCARRSGAERRRAQNCESRAAHRLLERGRGGRGASGREHREGGGDGAWRGFCDLGQRWRLARARRTSRPGVGRRCRHRPSPNLSPKFPNDATCFGPPEDAWPTARTTRRPAVTDVLGGPRGAAERAARNFSTSRSTTRPALFTPEAWGVARRRRAPGRNARCCRRSAATRRAGRRGAPALCGRGAPLGPPLEACWAKRRRARCRRRRRRQARGARAARARGTRAPPRAAQLGRPPRPPPAAHGARRAEPTPPGPHRKGGQKSDGLFVYSKDGGGLVRAKGVPGRRVGSMYPTGAVVAGGGV